MGVGFEVLWWEWSAGVGYRGIRVFRGSVGIG